MELATGDREELPPSELAPSAEFDTFDEFCDQLSQCATAEAVHALQAQYADSFSVEYSEKALAKVEMRIATIRPPRGSKSNQRNLVEDVDHDLGSRP